MICGTLQQPALSLLIKIYPRVVPRHHALGPHLPRHHMQLLELEMIVAKTAWNRCAPRAIPLGESTTSFARKTSLMINPVARNPNLLGGAARVPQQIAIPYYVVNHEES